MAFIFYKIKITPRVISWIAKPAEMRECRHITTGQPPCGPYHRRRPRSSCSPPPIQSAKKKKFHKLWRRLLSSRSSMLSWGCSLSSSTVLYLECQWNSNRVEFSVLSVRIRLSSTCNEEELDLISPCRMIR